MDAEAQPPSTTRSITTLAELSLEMMVPVLLAERTRVLVLPTL